MDAPKILNIGIDFGSSACMVVADNGVRATVPSCVGFPKDLISRRLLGKEYLCGDDAITNQLSCTLYYPLEGGVLKYSDHSRENLMEYQHIVWVAQILFRHLIHIATEGKPEDYIIRVCVGTPVLADMKNKQALIDLIGPIVGGAQIISEAFAVAYGMNFLDNSLVIDIGDEAVDLCRMHGVYPKMEDLLTTYKACNYIDNVFYESLEAKYPNSKSTINMLRTLNEGHIATSDPGQKIMLTLPVNGKPVQVDLTDDLRLACRSIVPDMAEAIKQLVSTYDPEFQEELKRNVILAGEGSQINGLCEELETCMVESLGSGHVVKVIDPVYAGANGALTYCLDLPEEYWAELLCA